MGYKTLSKNIFLVKNSVIQKELCITEKIISYALGISSSDKVKSLFEKAKMKIEEDCSYNDLNKIIAYLRSSDKEHVI